MKRGKEDPVKQEKKAKISKESLETIPSDAQGVILRFLRLKDLKQCRLVSKSFKELTRIRLVLVAGKEITSRVKQATYSTPKYDLEILDTATDNPNIEGAQFFGSTILRQLPTHLTRLYRYGGSDYNREMLNEDAFLQLKRFRHVTHLDLSSTMFDGHHPELPSDWAQHLQFLSLSGCHDFKIDLSQAKHLKEIRVQYNSSLAFELPPHLQRVVWDTVNSNSRLKELRFCESLRIVQCDFDFDNLPPNLTELDFYSHGGALTHPKSLAKLTKLRRLTISVPAGGLNSILPHLPPDVTFLAINILFQQEGAFHMMTPIWAPNLVEFELNSFVGAVFQGFESTCIKLRSVKLTTYLGLADALRRLKNSPITSLTLGKFKLHRENPDRVMHLDDLHHMELLKAERRGRDKDNENFESDGEAEEMDDDEMDATSEEQRGIYAPNWYDDPIVVTLKLDATHAQAIPPQVKILKLKEIRGKAFYENLPQTIDHVIFKNSKYLADDILKLGLGHLAIIITSDCSDAFKLKVPNRVMTSWEWKRQFGHLKYRQPEELPPSKLSPEETAVLRMMITRHGLAGLIGYLLQKSREGLQNEKALLELIKQEKSYRKVLE
eukprot:TRINITY_DN3351_c0_g1_i1.p1 TRINITY_DN3351_c0_g1~~TRINITY_DN3351_c0_g1_i1.p1  ORF type:complete len:607 (-),score=113.53 TRINITY_DN3351_c0_g1_i1:148-1968(-)